MLTLLVFFFSIRTVASISNQEDLAITNYSHIGCLQLRPQKEFVVNYIQQNPLLPYQTFSSSNLTIELCFRLCRRWIILVNKDQTRCTCLYTISEPYQLNDQLGEVLSTSNCTANDLQIYSLTKDFNTLPSVSRNYDWSLDGCYYLHGIQSIRANVALPNVTYTNAIDSCRNHCQTVRKRPYYSFFLSLKKSCYCLPIKLLPSITSIVVRKPLVHCSFLSYIKNGFEKSSLNYSKISHDTIIKIEVHNYCSSTFIFDRTFHLCLKSASLEPPHTTYMKLNTGEVCSPILIKTYEQWNYLISLESLLPTSTIIWIDRNSTYLPENLFRAKYKLSISNDLCIVINRNNLNRLPSYKLVLCSKAKAQSSVLCSQKPLETITSDEAEFNLTRKDQQSFIASNLTCPPAFILFNKICYFVPTSFVYGIPSGERLCNNHYSNSTLVKFDSHEWGNVDMGRFLGRTMNDVLLEFFYYQLEEKMANDLANNTIKKRWSRLLIGNKKDNNECVLRYFTRSSGAFTVLRRCNHGGHPVCQCDPIRQKISIDESININSRIKRDSSNIAINDESSMATTEITSPILLTSIDLPTESSMTSTEITSPISLTSIDLPAESSSMTSTEITSPITLTSLDLPTKSYTTIEPICDNCATTAADDDIFNKSDTENKPGNNDTSTINKGEQSKQQFCDCRPLVIFATGLLLGFFIIIIAIVFVILYVCLKNRESYTTLNNVLNLSHRSKPSAPKISSTHVWNTPAVLCTQLKSNAPSVPSNAYILNPFDNLITSNYNMPLLHKTTTPSELHGYIAAKDEEDAYYTTL